MNRVAGGVGVEVSAELGPESGDLGKRLLTCDDECLEGVCRTIRKAPFARTALPRNVNPGIQPLRSVSDSPFPRHRAQHPGRLQGVVGEQALQKVVATEQDPSEADRAGGAVEVA